MSDHKRNALSVKNKLVWTSIQMNIQILIFILLSAKASFSFVCPNIDSGALFKSCFVCQKATYLKTVQLRVKAACFILDRHKCCKVLEVKKPKRFHKSSRASFTVSNRVHLIWKINMWLLIDLLTMYGLGQPKPYNKIFRPKLTAWNHYHFVFFLNRNGLLRIKNDLF